MQQAEATLSDVITDALKPKFWLVANAAGRTRWLTRLRARRSRFSRWPWSNMVGKRRMKPVQADGGVERQGCSTLWNTEEVEKAIEAANGSAEAILGE